MAATTADIARINDTLRGAQRAAESVLTADTLDGAAAALSQARGLYVDALAEQARLGHQNQSCEPNTRRVYWWGAHKALLDAHRKFTERCISEGVTPATDDDHNWVHFHWVKAIEAAIARQPERADSHAQRCAIWARSLSSHPDATEGSRALDRFTDDAGVWAKRLAFGRVEAAALPKWQRKQDKGWKRDARGVLPRLRPAQHTFTD